MKKAVLSVVFAATALFGFSQKMSYRVGLVTAIPADMDNAKQSIALGSSMFEASRSISKKVVAVANVGYIKFKTDVNTTFAIVPITIGAKYPITESVNFGVAGGLGIYNKKSVGSTDFMFSPFVGVVVHKISVDVRYVNVVTKDNPIKTLALVFSYTL